MALGPAQLLILVLVPLGLGAALLRFLGISFRTDRLAYWGWAWMAGALGIAALELLRLLSGIPSPGPLIAAASALAAGLSFLGRRRPALPASAPLDWKRPAEQFFAALTLLAVLATLVRIASASTSAVVLGDEAIFWSRRAKLLFQAGSLGGSYANAITTGTLGHADYPILNPLLQLWVFDLAGRITHVANRLPIQLVSLALIPCAASALRRAVSPWVAGVLVVLIPTCYEAAFAVRLAKSDVLVALGGLVALDAYLRWRADGNRAWLGLASLGAAFLCWSKHEGLLVFTAALAAAVLSEVSSGGLRRLQRPRKELLWLLPPLLVLALTWLHNTWLGTAGSHAAVPGLVDRALNESGEKLAPVLRFLARLAVDPTMNALPAVFLVLALSCPAAWREPLRVPTLTILLVYLGLAAIYLTTNDRLDWLLQNSAQRVLFQTAPLLALWVAYMARAVLDARREHGGERRPDPPPGRAVAFPRGGLVRGALVLALVSWLIWKGAVATFSLAVIVGSCSFGQLQSAVSWSEEQRILWTLSERDHELGLPPGYNLVLYRTLMQHLGPEDALLAEVEGDLQTARILAPLPALIFPRAIRPVRLPDPERLAELDSLFVLDFRERYRERLEGTKTPLAAGPDWKLWR